MRGGLEFQGNERGFFKVLGVYNLAMKVDLALYLTYNESSRNV